MPASPASEPRGPRPQVTVGVDVGTAAVKAVAVDADGGVLAVARVPHGGRPDRPDRLEHDAARAWRGGVRAAVAQVAAGLEVAAIQVAAMVPSVCAVDDGGEPVTAGVLYGDARAGPPTGRSPLESGEATRLLAWCATAAPGAHGYWPAQAVANHALCGRAAIDPVTALTWTPLVAGRDWDADALAALGVRVDQVPPVLGEADAVGLADVAPGALVGAGTVDALAEQLVAGADEPGDVLVILGSTLVAWVVSPTWQEAPGLWTMPHTVEGRSLVGGPSNAGGLFIGWVGRMVRGGGQAPDPARVPVWLPYPRGERVPLHDPGLRASLHDLDVSHGPAAARRAAYEASAFVVRRHVELAGVPPRRVIATGGGTRDPAWVQALADGTGLPVDVVAVPEGAALGAAWLARVVAGLEPTGTGSSRWACVGRRVEPDPAWVGPTAERYARFTALSMLRPPAPTSPEPA